MIRTWLAFAVMGCAPKASAPAPQATPAQVTPLPAPVAPTVASPPAAAAAAWRITRTCDRNKAGPNKPVALDRAPVKLGKLTKLKATDSPPDVVQASGDPRVEKITVGGRAFAHLAIRIDESRAVAAARDGVYMVSYPTKELQCMTAPLVAGHEVAGFYAVTRDATSMGYASALSSTMTTRARTFDLHVVDLVAGIDTNAATVDDAYTVVFAAADRQFVVHVGYHTRDRMAFYTIDLAGAVRRVTNEIPGWTNMGVTGDGKTVSFARQARREERPPKPEVTPRDRDDRGPGTCDPINPCDQVRCSWQSNHCNDYVWCDGCPKAKAAPEDGQYLLRLP